MPTRADWSAESMRPGKKQQIRELTARLIALQQAVEELTERCSEQERRIHSMQLASEQRVTDFEAQRQDAKRREQHELAAIQQSVDAHRDELSELKSLLPDN